MKQVVSRVAVAVMSVVGILGGTPVSAEVIPLNGVGVTISENYGALQFENDQFGMPKSKAGSVFGWTLFQMDFRGNGVFDSSALNAAALIRNYWVRTTNWDSHKTYRVSVKQPANVKMAYFDTAPSDNVSHFVASLTLEFRCSDRTQPNDSAESSNTYDKQMNGASEWTDENRTSGPTNDLTVSLIHDFKPNEQCSFGLLSVLLRVTGNRVVLNPMEISILEAGNPL